jgi:hypothetical protein
LPIPLRWDVETSRAPAYAITLYRGESIYLEPRYLSYGTPLDLSAILSVEFRYRSADMAVGTYYRIEADLHPTNVGRVRIPWTPTNETPASAFTYGVWTTTPTGEINRCYGTLKLQGTIQGAITNTPEVVHGVVDWSLVEHLNLSSAPFVTTVAWAASNAALQAQIDLLGPAAIADLSQRVDQVEIDLAAIPTNTPGNAVTSVNGQTGAVALAASDLPCTGSYTNVQDALDALLYVAPSITALTGGGTYIKGQTIADPAITWTVNKTMTTRGISGVATATLGAGGSGTYTDTGRNLATSGTYTLTVGDGTGTDSEGETFTFTNRRYVGASATTNQTNAEIIAMTASTQAKGASGTTGALTAEYLVIAYPASLGACTAFSLGGFSTTAWPSVTKAVTNAYGYAESYLVYRTENAQTTGGIAYDIH